MNIKFDSNKLVSHVSATLLGGTEEELKVEDLAFVSKYSEKEVQDLISK